MADTAAGLQGGDWCADVSTSRDEPLFATAPRVARWLLVEHTAAWGPESVPSGRMPPSVARALAEQAADWGARLLLVRRPGARAGADLGGRWVFAVDSRPGHEQVLSRHPEEDVQLLDLDLDGPGWQVHAEPLHLVCTHGSNDRCCATRGRPVAAAMAAASPSTTWECSHLGGDRFAANLLVLPEGLIFGRVQPEDVVRIAALAVSDPDPDTFRGRSSQPAPVQAAQAFARARLGTQLAFVEQTARGGNVWDVSLEGGVTVSVAYDRKALAPAVLSCGDPAKTAPGYRLVSLERVPGRAVPPSV